MFTDEAEEEDDERLLVLTASGERLRLEGGERLEPHSADEDDDVDSLRVGLQITPDEWEMRVESTRLLKGLSQPSLVLAAHMSKLLVELAEEDGPERDMVSS